MREEKLALLRLMKARLQPELRLMDFSAWRTSALWAHWSSGLGWRKTSAGSPSRAALQKILGVHFSTLWQPLGLYYGTYSNSSIAAYFGRSSLV